MDEKELRDLLEREAARINCPAFIADDPVQFPRRFTSLPDIEVAALLCATIAWGRRTMICRDCERLLAMMDNSPYRYMMEEGYEQLPDRQNIHRTFFAENLKCYLRGLKGIYRRHDSLNDFARHHGVGYADEPAWRLAELLQHELCMANNGRLDNRCLPSQLSTTALKRLNLALRWLVRDDGIVDLGVWNCIEPSQLFIPLDVHVAETSRALGLIHRKQNDRRTVRELTAALRRFNANDPVLYDYALFGIGIEQNR